MLMLVLAAAGCGTESAMPDAPERASVAAVRAAAASPAPDARPDAPTLAPSEPAAKQVSAPPVTECPAGVVAAPGWPGEYPDPVVHVTEPVVVPSRAHPCAKDTQSCGIEPGMLHPWAGVEGHTFVTVRAVQGWSAAEAFQLGTQQLAASDTVQLTQEIGEGFCAYQRGDDSFQAQCPALLKGKLEQEPVVEWATEQLVGVPCANVDGVVGWVAVNDALMAVEGVRKGAFEGYGKVVPAPR